EVSTDRELPRVAGECCFQVPEYSIREVVRAYGLWHQGAVSRLQYQALLRVRGCSDRVHLTDQASSVLGMIQNVDCQYSQLQFHSLGELDALRNTEIQVVDSRRGERVTSKSSQRTSAATDVACRGVIRIVADGVAVQG